ncbi:MAG: hypothetical protein ACRDQB_17015 [Thermocrispum sp.]
MADQRRDDEQHGEQPGSDLQPVHRPNPPAVPDPAAAEPVDAEELRRFREFQQFQEFQRFQQFQRAQDADRLPPGEGTGGVLEPASSREIVPPQPAEPKPTRKAPAWLVTLGGKIVGALLLLAALVVGGAWAIDYFLGADDPITPQEQADQGGRKAQGTKLYASSPYEAVRRIYDDVAQGVTDDICLRFDEQARGQFAASFNHETCADAAADLHRQVTNVDAYAESLPSTVSNPSLGDEIEIDSCAVALPSSGVVGGPALGVFTVSKIPQAEGEQWLITGHLPGPEKCPKKSP